MNVVWFAAQFLGAFPNPCQLGPKFVASFGLMKLPFPLGPSILSLTLAKDSSKTALSLAVGFFISSGQPWVEGSQRTVMLGSLPLSILPILCLWVLLKTQQQ